MSEWPVEKIPDADVLYYRVHKRRYLETSHALPEDAPQDELPPNLFKFIKGDLSVDWSKYTTPQKSKDRANVPDDNGIVEFEAGAVRAQGHTVVHTPVHTPPEQRNRAHSSVCGDEPKVRITLSRIAQWTAGFGPESIGL